MPTIKLTDQFGLDLNAQPAATSALLKYFQQIPSLRLDSLDLSKAGGLTLDQPAIRSLSTGVSFQDPVNLGEGAPAFAVAAGAHASVKLITNSDGLPGQDDSAQVPNDACYVSFTVEASASAGISAQTGKLNFGVSPSAGVELASYSRFPLNAGVTLLDALRQTVAGFAVPFSHNDLAGLSAGQITRVALNGTLEISGSADLLAVTNPLASAALPAPLPTVSVSAGGSVTAGITCTIQAGFEIVVCKLDSGAVRLGWYRTRGTEVTVNASASEGISAGIGSSDLLSQLIGAISASPKADLQELSNAGVPASQAADIQTAVKAAAARKVEIAVGAGFTSGSSHAAAFLYEIDLAALTAESSAAVDQALHGNLTGLHAPGLPGVSCVKSIWDDVRKRKVELRVNLLGILNYRSVTALSLEGRVLYDPVSGELAIADTATAQRIQTTAVNIGADTQKLRHVLAESFLITAAYRSARQSPSTAFLRCTHSFFELQNSTSSSDMARKLRTGVALGLLSADDATPPAGVANFGRTLFTASADYDDDLVERLFLDSGESPLPRETYEAAGRYAIQALVHPGDPDDVRLRPATDDALWARMKDVGQPSFSNLFLRVPAPLVAAIATDYSTIQWWASAMFDTAHQLAKVRLWLTRNPEASLDSPDFQKLRNDLAAHLRGVAANTRDEFGDPWGLIAINRLAGPTAPSRLMITGSMLVLDKRRTQVAAHPAGS